MRNTHCQVLPLCVPEHTNALASGERFRDTWDLKTKIIDHCGPFCGGNVRKQRTFEYLLDSVSVPSIHITGQ